MLPLQVRLVALKLVLEHNDLEAARQGPRWLGGLEGRSLELLGGCVVVANEHLHAWVVIAGNNL